jgi:hypothetical protein
MERLYSKNSTQSDLNHYTINRKDSAMEKWRRDDESESGDLSSCSLCINQDQNKAGLIPRAI